MIHRRQGIPSKGWLMAYLKRHMNQRITFQLGQTSWLWKAFIEQGAFNAADPIWVSGIFCGIYKRPSDWPSWYASGPIKIHLIFRGLMFRQGDNWTRDFKARSHHMNNRELEEFELSEIRGVKWADALQTMVLRLGYTPGRFDCSEGSSGKGFPSTKEPNLPSRGSNSVHDDVVEE